MVIPDSSGIQEARISLDSGPRLSACRGRFRPNDDLIHSVEAIFLCFADAHPGPEGLIRSRIVAKIQPFFSKDTVFTPFMSLIVVGKIKKTMAHEINPKPKEVRDGYDAKEKHAFTGRDADF